MKVENLYTSIACNRTTECADWGANGLIAFGAYNAVAILDPKYNGNSAKIINTYVQHTKRVITVQWLRPNDGKSEEVYLLSGSDDGLAILWHLEERNAPKYYYLRGHKSGVNALSGIQMKTGNAWLMATTSSDNTLKLWRFVEGQVNDSIESIQTLSLSGGFCFSIRMTFLPRSDHVLLAFSMHDGTIALLAQPQNVAGGDNVEPQSTFLHQLPGHDDWVRGLDFTIDGDDLLLASGAQDNFIRLWRISPRTEAQSHQNAVERIDDFSGEIQVEEKILKLGANSWCAVSLESVLYGHENWVYGVQWHRSEMESLRLLSSSIDKTLIIWEPKEDGIWMEKVRVGEVGGNSVGFYGGKFSSDGKSIMGHSYQGGFHIWNQSTGNPSIWKPNVIVGGHFNEVRDLAWDPQGEYLMTVSADQTTRLHAPWRQKDNDEASTWHELARPQVHGFDMQALTLLSRYRFTSGAEEKIIRAFQAPANFIENFRRLCRISNDDQGDTLLETLPKGASVPSLGLSNKAVFKSEEPPAKDRHVKDEYPENYFVPISMETPPQEETLMQNTLWPEVQKLYGHGYDIYALASTTDGQLLASSCRATNAEHAQIILWNTNNWKQLQKLTSHELTVTQMRFSHNCRYLLSVSRDRRWSLFERQETEGTNVPGSYTLVASSNKTNGFHTRIIWGCDWTHDDKYFVTSSRDGKVALWTCKENAPTENGWKVAHSLELKNESITAVAFATHTIDDGYILALGMESGDIRIYHIKNEWNLLAHLTKNQAHHKTVKRLQFRPTKNLKHLELASCGEDSLVRIYNLLH